MISSQWVGKLLNRWVSWSEVGVSLVGGFYKNLYLVLRSLKLAMIFLKLEIVLHSWPEAWNFIKKETLAEMFSCEFCEIFKSTFLYRTPLDNCFSILLAIEHMMETSELLKI